MSLFGCYICSVAIILINAFEVYKTHSSQIIKLALPFYYGCQFSVKIITAETKGLSKGFQVGSNKANVSHLQFADDTLILAEGNERNVMVLKSLI